MNVNELLSLKGKVILITGGTGLYGRPMFEALAEAGGKVITASRSLESAKQVFPELQNAGLDVHAMQVDQADHDSVLKLKNDIVKQFGGLDVFVNNAVARPMRKYADPLEAFTESMRINATGMFDITREMADVIAQSGGGTIINIASMQGMFGADFSLYEGTEMDSPPDYHFHKGGMITLTKYLARKLAPKKVRVNCISPGGLYGGQPETFIQKYAKKVPAGRMAGPDDIKGVVVFLASDASAYINGENILMDGGMHA
ncbi:MAG: short-chain dehydrogenase [Planctomycetes bacterium GWF2_50_10]|nr:MAG: short-chain dehydrogenase [Planctomycetes bacterium GWF2_50_10]